MRFLSTLGLSMIAVALLAQDTTVVSTLTFDSITTRRGWWEFPPASEQFRKVLMVHTLKCDPQTTWDGYDCGEWDYLTYHFVHEHTGVLDSTALQHPYFMVGTAAPDSVVSAEGHPLNEHQRWLRRASVVSVANSTLATIGTNDTTDANSFLGFTRRSQYMYTAEELLSAGLVAGPVHELRFHPLGPDGALDVRCTIRMKNTTASALSRFDDQDLLTVFDAGLSFDTLSLVLIEPFIWDGTSNVLIDIAQESSDDFVPVTLEASHAAAGMALQEIGDDDAVRTDNDFIGVDPAPLAGLNDAVTITFRTFGAPQLPINTSLLEAVGANGQRILNIHLPWSDGRIYWDAGSDGSAYDRIDKASNEAEFEGGWTDWAFVKNATTGSMKIYKNGAVWYTGSGKTKPLSGIVRMRVGSDANGGNPYPGMIDGLNIFNTEVSAATIAAWYDRKTTPAHPDFGSLICSFEMDEGVYPGLPWLDNAVSTEDRAWLMGTVKREHRPATALFRNSSDPGTRPVVTFGQGDYTIAIDSLITSSPGTDFLPQLSREIFAVQGNAVVPVDTVFEYSTGWTFTYGPDGDVIDSVLAGGTLHVNDTLDYFGVPYEVINDHEIGRYITPYGIGLSLGPTGFSWVYDVTDYQYLLHDSVELSAGNTQELIDLKFLMVHGDAPRPVVNVQHPWGPMRSYGYGGLSDDTQLHAVTVALHPDASQWMMQARLTGHGDATSIPGVQGCCEFKDNEHTLFANGTEADQWHIWRTEDCADNPVYPQGGTWIYAREGWCPGDVVRDRATELTSFVNGDSLTLDYGITPVPQNNPGMAGGNYVINMDLFEFGDPSHAFDAEIYDVLRPSDTGLRSRQNPICNDPVLVLRNNGTGPITAVTFYYQVSGGQPVTYIWNGSLAPNERTEVELPVYAPNFWAGDGQNFFEVSIIGVNGGDLDGYGANDHYRTHFEMPVIYPDNFVLYYKTNNRPDENALYVRDFDGNTVFSRTTFTAATVYRDTLQLAPGCYELEFTDSGNDGLKYWADPDAGAGYFRFRSLTNQTLRTFEPEFGHRIYTAFGIGAITGISEEHHGIAFTAQPNPSDGRFTLSMEGILGDARLDLMDATGRLMSSNALKLFERKNITLDLSGEADGVYLVRLVHEGGAAILRLAKR
jgi:hypothetical protein